MSSPLPFPHLSFSLQPFVSHPLLLLVPALLILLFASSAWRAGRWLFLAGLLGAAGYGMYALYQGVNDVMAKHPHQTWVVMPMMDSHHHESALPVLPVHGPNYGLVAVLLVVALIVLLVWGMVRASGYSFGYALNRLWVSLTQPITKGGGREDTYTFPDVTIGTVIGEAEPGLPDAGKGAGKRVVIGAKDRFLNMGIIGPIGSGKTFMTMKPMIYQDLEALARGVMANVVWISPQPEPSIESYAEKLGLTVRRIHIIDGQVGEGKTTNIRFNPLAGNDIDAIINNVNVVLNEQTGDRAKGEAFFDIMAAQATTDSLQLYKFLHGFDDEGNPVEIDMIGWYDRYLVQMDELFTEATRVQMVADHEAQGALDQPLPEPRAEWIRTVVWPKLTEPQRVMLRRAAASIINEFGGSLTGKNAEAYKNIIRGLRGKVRVLISSQYVQELLGTEVAASAGRPNFDFETWIDPPEWARPKAEDLKAWKQGAPHGRKGELLSVITGQTETGKLVGRMVLVFLQQAVLNRPGKDNDKPPVYTYVDEYPSYATRSINEIRTQGRKHCHSMVMAMQSRAQMEQVGKGYLETMEGSTRHWVYLSNLGADDAQAVSKLCGRIKRIKTNTSTRQIRMGGLGRDRGEPLVTKTEQEEWVDRFSPHFIRYGLTENEVIYIGVKERKGQNPVRMRITEPGENRSLMKQVAGGTVKKSVRQRRPRPVSVYPKADTVARVKWPLLTLGNQTLYVYRWGVSLGRDVYAPRKTRVDHARTIDVDPPGLPGGEKVQKDSLGHHPDDTRTNTHPDDAERTNTPAAEKPNAYVRPQLRIRTDSLSSKSVFRQEPGRAKTSSQQRTQTREFTRPRLTLRREQDYSEKLQPARVEIPWQEREQLTRQSLRRSTQGAPPRHVKVGEIDPHTHCPLDGEPMQLRMSGNRKVWVCTACGHRVRA
ncbi:type IV secretory system conjugative DNA transfer family protein [Alicyclobacillus kakegawensis]|uniref:type IV secretory system conjugative DNA transfer family protein n=1 Tax=Alicyclobacillus kakegawensis TaxID=392012 RepID=UPI00082B1ED8|nr:TraM recognition domain-containing protein [Alicyclobacillus kakegawensis]